MCFEITVLILSRVSLKLNFVTLPYQSNDVFILKILTYIAHFDLNIVDGIKTEAKNKITRKKTRIKDRKIQTDMHIGLNFHFMPL